MSAVTSRRHVRIRTTGDDRAMHFLLVVIAAILIVALIGPLYALLSHSLKSADGTFVGLANFARFLSDPTLATAAWNSFFIAFVSTAITMLLGLGFAYCLTRSKMPGRAIFRSFAMIPLLAPSLLPAIALVFLLGEKGLARSILMGNSVYGPIGIVIGEVIFSFPQAVLILSTSLATADQRLYDAALSLRTSAPKTFMTVTLPGIRYGLISASLAIFVKVFTDFGVPAVIGGSYPVLATEIYKQVVAQFDFGMGAVVGIFLLVPAVLAFAIQRFVQRFEVATVSAQSVPLEVKPAKGRDLACLLFSILISGCLLVVIGFAVFGSLVSYWPYNLSLTLRNYRFGQASAAGWSLYSNSLLLAFLTATFGTALTFTGAWLIERTRGWGHAKAVVQLMATLPVAVPGLVLGLSYIFFFNNPANPLAFTYGTMTILVLSSIVHFYTIPHIIATAALKQLDKDLDIVAASLKVPFYKMFLRVVIPFCTPAIVDIWGYLFVNAMTTVSAVIFLYAADTLLASIAIVQWNDSGRMTEAAAMSVSIFATSAAVLGLKTVLMRGYFARNQAWRTR